MLDTKLSLQRTKSLTFTVRFFFLINVSFLYFWLPWSSLLCLGFLWLREGSYSVVVVGRLPIAVASFVAEHRL